MSGLPVFSFYYSKHSYRAAHLRFAVIKARRLIKIIGFIGLVAPASSATAAPGVADAEAAIAILRAQDDAILKIGERLIVAGLPFCPESGRSAGMTIQLRAQYGADFRAAASAAMGIGDLPTVSAIAPGSAAEQAGLQVGDRIAAIDGHRFVARVPTRTGGDFGPTAAALDVIEAALADGRANLETLRRDAVRMVTIAPRAACHARFDVRAGRSANASSDGVQVQVASDLIADTRNDGEIAAVLAHELSHNILRHPQRLKGPLPRPSVRQTEIEADRLSVYLLDAAGYGPTGAETFWGRWGKARDWGILATGTHPGWKQRIRIIRGEADRIDALRRAGQPVLPPADLTPPRR